MTELWRLRRSEGYEAHAGEVRVEKRGKSSLADWELLGPVNSIRSNTVEGTHRLTRPFPRRWLDRTGNDAAR